MFSEEFFNQLSVKIRAMWLEAAHDYISKEHAYGLSLTKAEVMEIIGVKSATTFDNYYRKYLEFATIRSGKGLTDKSLRWSRDLVIAWFQDEKNLRKQREKK